MRLISGNKVFLSLCAAIISASTFIVTPANAAKLAQAITFDPPTTLTATASPLTLSATVNSPLAVSFTSSSSSVCTVSRTILTVKAAGTCTITAKQSGNAAYAAATPVIKTISITRVDPNPLVISNTDLGQTVGGSISLTTTGGSTSGAVTFTKIGDCKLSGKTLTSTVSSRCEVTASKAADAKFNASVSSAKTFIFFPVLSAAKINSQKIPTSFQNLSNYLTGISYAAWAKSAAQIKTGNSYTGIINIVTGPNTVKTVLNPQEAIHRTSRLYSANVKPSKTSLIYYSRTDINWAQTEFNTSMNNGRGTSGSEASYNCQVGQNCWGASAWVNSANEGVVLIAVEMTDSNHTSGTLEAHEFTHTIQTSQSPMTAYHLPRWLLEGGAEWSQGAAIHYLKFKDYQDERKRNTGDLFNNSATYNKAWITEFLTESVSDGWSNQNHGWRLYDVGSLTTEILAALKGPTSVMNLYVRAGTGMTWAEAFKAEYGSEWSDAVPYIADAIAKELAGNI